MPKACVPWAKSPRSLMRSSQGHRGNFATNVSLMSVTSMPLCLGTDKHTQQRCGTAVKPVALLSSGCGPHGVTRTCVVAVRVWVEPSRDVAITCNWNVYVPGTVGAKLAVALLALETVTAVGDTPT